MATDSSDHKKQDWISHLYLVCYEENGSLNLENSLMQDLHSGNHCCMSVIESGTNRVSFEADKGRRGIYHPNPWMTPSISQILPTISPHKTTPKSTHMHGEPFPSLNAVTSHRRVEQKGT